MSKSMYTKAEAAHEVGVSEKTIDRAIKDEALPAKMIGTRHIRIRHEDLMEWVDALPDYIPPRGSRL